MGHDGRSSGHGASDRWRRRFSAVWYLLHGCGSVQPGAPGLCPAGAGICRRMLLPGHMQLPLADQSSWRRWRPSTTCSASTARWMPVFGQEQYAQIPMAVAGHRDEVLPDSHFRRRRAWRRAAYPIVGYNMGAGRNGFASAGAVHDGCCLPRRCVGAAVAARAGEGCPPVSSSRFSARPTRAEYYTRSLPCKAFRVYLCMMMLACVNKACFHLSRRPWARPLLVYAAVHVPRGGVRRRALRCCCRRISDWTAILYLHAGFGRFDLFHCGRPDRKTVSRIPHSGRAKCIAENPFHRARRALLRPKPLRTVLHARRIWLRGTPFHRSYPPRGQSIKQMFSIESLLWTHRRIADAAAPAMRFSSCTSAFFPRSLQTR